MKTYLKLGWRLWANWWGGLYALYFFLKLLVVWGIIKL